MVPLMGLQLCVSDMLMHAHLYAHLYVPSFPGLFSIFVFLFAFYDNVHKWKGSEKLGAFIMCGCEVDDWM